MKLSNLKPVRVWRHFFQICAVPHPSHYEQALALEISKWASGRGFESLIDGSGNTIIRRPASPGSEGVPGIILQAHLDMVPQAASGISHEFLKDPIRPRLDPENPGWVTASGTTLGADDGIGLALAMSALEDEDLSDVPLECLFTTCEEDGMGGARGLEPDSLKGRILLNLDGEDDAELTIGCAGSIRTAGELSRPPSSAEDGLRWFEASVEGLLGGHSGMDIDKGRANAILALSRILARSDGDLRLASLEGGTAGNVIPATARALAAVSESDADAFRESFRREASILHSELGSADPGLKADLVLSKDSAPDRALGGPESAKLLSLLKNLPNGLVAMEPDMPDCVRTSLNLGRLTGRTEDGRFRVETLTMVRSSSEADKRETAERFESKLREAEADGWEVRISRPAVAPAWTPEPGSPLLALAKKTYADLFGKDIAVTSTHGGLETGIFRPRFPDWDMISLGPNILYPHSPDERVEIASVERSYRFLKELILRLG